MRATILSIGDELVLGQTLDRHAQWLSRELAALGVVAVEHRTVDDDRAAIAAAVRVMAERGDVLLITGGLGPTEDDLTREALGDVVAPGQPLLMDDDARERLRRLFERRGRTMPVGNERQALRPPTMEFLANPNGTAPGLMGTWNGCLIVAMPGPPREMYPMFHDLVVPALALPESRDVLREATVGCYGLGESDAAQRLGDLMRRDRDPLVGTTVSQSICSARIRTRGPASTVDAAVEATRAEVERLWHPYAFGRDAVTLPAAVVDGLHQAGKTLALAESCTGGRVAAMIVDIPGSSACFHGGWVTYTNTRKTEDLGVDPTLIETHGAVSAPVARAMALGARQRAGTDLAAAITGIAGPGGGTATKPVGLVFIALAGPSNDDADVEVRRFVFPGIRDQVRDRSAKSALQMIRFALLGERPPLLWELSA